MHLIAKFSILSLSFFGVSRSQDFPCSLESSVDISDGNVLNEASIEYKNYVYSENEYFIYDNRTLGCICLKRPCITKCCPENQLFVDMNCQNLDEFSGSFDPPFYGSNLRNATQQFHIFNSLKCADKFEIDAKIESDGNIVFQEYKLSHTEGCVELSVTPNKTSYVYMKCLSDDDLNMSPELKDILKIIGFIISSLFLMATFFVYAFITEIRNLNGKCVMNLVFSLAFSLLMIALSNIQTYTIILDNNPSILCLIFAYLNYFFLASGFLWMNVLCIDIYFTFSKDIQAPMFERRAMEKTRYWIYFAYAWCTAATLVIICLIFDNHPEDPSYIVKPGMGINKCWFAKGDPEMYYVYIPMTIIIIVNLVLFVLTTLKLLRVSRQTSVLRTNKESSSTQYTSNRERFFVHLKLFVVMGINWTTEVISYFIGGNDNNWLLTDFLNTIMGVYIFIIFVWKPKMKRLIKQRYNTIKSGPSLSSYRSRTTNQRSIDDSVNQFSVAKDTIVD